MAEKEGQFEKTGKDIRKISQIFNSMVKILQDFDYFGNIMTQRIWLGLAQGVPRPTTQEPGGSQRAYCTVTVYYHPPTTWVGRISFLF